jgi:aspartate beta-hydroxylase
VSQLYDWACGRLRSFYDARIETPPILDRDRYFPRHRAFRENWRAIRAECLELMRDIGAVPQFHELMAEQKSLSGHGNRFWRLFVLRAYGVDLPDNQARLPLTTSLFKDRPEVQSVTLSFLEGHKHIPAHRGPFRGVLRYHLGLVIPPKADGSSSNRMRIDGVMYELHEGSDLLWDDTYMHEVWNDSELVRAALLIDVIRPQMPLLPKLLTRLVLLIVGLAVRVRGLRHADEG